MEYRELVSVTGIGGLFQLVNTKSDGAIVRSLADKTVKFISARQHQVTPLESIEIFTTSDNVRLHKIFEAMSASSVALPDTTKADNKAIADYFRAIYPDMDEDRVYASDRKKILKWYVILKENQLLDFSKLDQPAAVEAAPEEPVVAEVAAPAEKPKAKKAAAKKEAVEGEEKPKKKAAPKKKAE